MIRVAYTITAANLATVPPMIRVAYTITAANPSAVRL